MDLVVDFIVRPYCRATQSKYFENSVLTPYLLGVPHPSPKLTTPMREYPLSPSVLVTRGPPVS